MHFRTILMCVKFVLHLIVLSQKISIKKISNLTSLKPTLCDFILEDIKRGPLILMVMSALSAKAKSDPFASMLYHLCGFLRLAFGATPVKLLAANHFSHLLFALLVSGCSGRP